MPGSELEDATVEARRRRSQYLMRVTSVLYFLLFLAPLRLFCRAAYFQIWDSVISDQPLVGCCVMPADQYRVLRGTYKTMPVEKLKREALLVPLKLCTLTVNDTAAILPQRGLMSHEVLSLTMPPDSFKVYEWAHGGCYVVCKNIRDKVIMRYLIAIMSVGTYVLIFDVVKSMLWFVWWTFTYTPPPRRPPRDAVQND